MLDQCRIPPQAPTDDGGVEMMRLRPPLSAPGPQRNYVAFRGEDIISQTVRAEGGPDNIPTEDCEVTFQRQSRHLFDVVTSVIVPGFSVVEPLEA